MKTFDEIGNEVGTDKVSCGYGPLYENFVFPYVPRFFEARILELGVHNGASMRLWEKLYPSATIVGVDNDMRCAIYESDRTQICIGDAASKAFLATLPGPFDLVVDDCSHAVEDILASFEALWPQTASVFVIEDVWHEHLPQVMAAVQKVSLNVVACASKFPNRHIVFVRRSLN